MLRIAVCDDERNVCSEIEDFIIRVCKENKIEYKIDVFYSGTELKEHLIKENRYNLFFLDIELDNESGITLSDFIRNEIKDDSAQIIYVSGKTEYDRQLFEFRPFAFIEKPFDAETIRNTLNKYLRIYGHRNNIFRYKYGHYTYWTRLSTVLYFKSDRKRISIVSVSGREEFYGKISSLIKQLSTQGFISPHKSYLVNYHYIKRFQTDLIIMTNGDEIPISKGKREEIFKFQLAFENWGR